MTLSMCFNVDMQILQEMNDGVVLLDAQGSVLAHNDAADRWMQEGQSVRSALKGLVEHEANAGAPLPRQVELFLGPFNQPKTRTKAWLCRNGHQGYAVLIASPATRTAPAQAHVADTDASDMSSTLLLSHNLGEQMAELRSLLGRAQGTTDDHAKISVTYGDIDRLLQTICKLSLLKQRDHVFLDERLDLVDELQHLIPSLATHPEVHYVFSPQPGPRGMVYGSKAWLNQALRVLLESLGRSAPTASNIEIALRQLGDFVVVTGHVVAGSGSCPPAHAVAHDKAHASSKDQSVLPQEQAIQQAMCRRIIELHAGQLKLEYMPTPGVSTAQEPQIESFTLTLATGLPEHERSRVSCKECRYTLQAQAYALDMALLMSPKNHTTTGAPRHDQSTHR